MPYVNNHGVRIHYHLDGPPSGPPLVMQHGLLNSLDDWYALGYVEALGETHRLILVDARGHGQSDKPHDPVAYRAAAMAADIVAVLDDLGLAQAHCLGYSMGGMIVLGLAAYAPARCRSIIVGGSSADDREPTAGDPWNAILRQGPQALTEAMGPLVWPALRARLPQSDTEALLANRTLLERRGFAEALRRANVPCLIYAGEADPVHDRARAITGLMPQARFVSLPGLDHISCQTRTDLVLPPIVAFLAEVA